MPYLRFLSTIIPTLIAVCLSKPAILTLFRPAEIWQFLYLYAQFNGNSSVGYQILAPFDTERSVVISFI